MLRLGHCTVAIGRALNRLHISIVIIGNRTNVPISEKGKLQLWIEIFDPEHIPEPIDLTPLPPRAYELRVIVWNTADVILDEKNVFGKYMTDIYVKG